MSSFIFISCLITLAFLSFSFVFHVFLKSLSSVPLGIFCFLPEISSFFPIHLLIPQWYDFFFPLNIFPSFFQLLFIFHSFSCRFTFVSFPPLFTGVAVFYNTSFLSLYNMLPYFILPFSPTIENVYISF